MLMALVLASVTQFQVIVEQPVFYELPTVQAVTSTTFEYSYMPVVRSVPTVMYSVPAFPYYMRADPFVRAHSPFLGGRTVIKERGPGFRSKTIMRY
jgi:hypothetical protein